MAASVYKFNGTGGGVVWLTATVPTGRHYQLVSVSIALDAAPTTSENFTITLNANAGAEYDVLLYSLDLSVGSTTDLMWSPESDIILGGGDSIDVAYTNTDTGTYGVQITMRTV